MGLFKDWKEVHPEGFYRFAGTVKANGNDIALLKSMLSLFQEHKDEIDGDLTYFVDNSKKFKGRGDFEALLKLY